ncbi:MAG: MFS transporter [Alphaproteobacteria bacterium]
MRVDRNVKLLNLHALCVNMAFVIPVIMPFYRDEMRLSFQDFLLGEAAFALTIVLLDVPCGWLSDQWQRKHILALGTLMELTGYALLLMSKGLLMAALAQSVIGVGICLFNGTNSAILYESLMAEGREGEYRRREGKRGGLGLYSVAFASVVGGLIYPHNHFLPVTLAVVVQCIGLFFACALDEPERHRKRPEKHPVADIIETTRYALRHPEVGMLLVFAAVMFCSTKLIMWTQQPYYMAMGLREEFFGVLMAVGFVLGGFSSQMAHRLDGKVGTYTALMLGWGMAVVACLGAAIKPGFAGVAMLMVGGTCIYGMTAPRVSEAINRHVDSSRRATVLSTQSLLVSLLFMPVSAVMGRVSEAYGVQAVLVSLALWLGVAGVALAVFGLRRRKRELEVA